MRSMPVSLRVAFISVSLGFGLAMGCDEQTNNPDDGEDGNLCTEYKTCNDCIAGQQGKGKTKGEAETMCGAAVMGCWTTWDKPIVCGEKEMKKEEAEG